MYEDDLDQDEIDHCNYLLFGHPKPKKHRTRYYLEEWIGTQLFMLASQNLGQISKRIK